MKKIIRYAGLMILALSALSCTDSRVSGDRRYGYLTVGVSDELDDLVHLKSEEEEDIVYRLDLYYSDDVLAKTIEDHRTVTEEEPIELLMDKYRVTATSGEAFTRPSMMVRTAGVCPLSERSGLRIPSLSYPSEALSAIYCDVARS